MFSLSPSISKYDETTKKFITSKTVEISYRYSSIIDDLRILIEENLPNLCQLTNEPLKYSNGTKFYCTIKDILTNEGEFWVEREFSIENEEKFQKFIHILSLVAISYQSLKQVSIGQLVGLFYELSWHRALVISTNEQQTSARVRLVDYGSSLYVNISQLKWLPEQFYRFPFKAVECIFSEAIKPTFSDTVRLTFKQLALNKRFHATVYDRDGTRICVLLKCRTDEGIINVYRYLRAYEHRSQFGRLLADGEIIHSLKEIIPMKNYLFLQTPPTPIQLTREQIKQRRIEIEKISRGSIDDETESIQSSPLSAATVITPMPRLSFAQQ